jgi:hypothetical protein
VVKANNLVLENRTLVAKVARYVELVVDNDDTSIDNLYPNETTELGRNIPDPINVDVKVPGYRFYISKGHHIYLTSSCNTWALTQALSDPFDGSCLQYRPRPR